MAAKNRYVLGLQNMQLAATSFPSGAALGPFLAGSACPMLTWCCRLAGPLHSTTLLKEEQLCCCAALLRLQLSSAPSSATLRCAPGASLSLSAASSHRVVLGRPLTWHAVLGCGQACFAEGWLCLAVCSCMRLVSLPYSAGPGQH